ncbi:hypothetical protein SLE2022_173600 [Rubroshorea leprosula]
MLLCFLSFCSATLVHGANRCSWVPVGAMACTSCSGLCLLAIDGVHDHVQDHGLPVTSLFCHLPPIN